ncbi:metal-dependent transcriptional regulator [Brachybacterium hainanense]|uniref:Metal-dependent transcriptional regulator n=1 Tax=Brachybacterium hainanense TaxID=1541174 RepID=A0ABV6RFR5_9MICO
MSNDLIDTTEMYLKAVFELEEAHIPPMRARIAERLGHSGPTVSQTVARMERDGLLHLDEERHIRLTQLGWSKATSVMRKHRLAERHLLDHLGLEYALVHEEACRWEHVMSLEVERRIAERLEPPYIDPYGNPIPGLAELGVDGVSVETGVTDEGKDHPKRLNVLLADAPDGATLDASLVRIGEWAQSEADVLGELARHGLRPGAEVHVERIGDIYALTAQDGATLEISERIAGQLAVRPLTQG